MGQAINKTVTIGEAHAKEGCTLCKGAHGQAYL
jgi:hypothetical protein